MMTQTDFQEYVNRGINMAKGGMIGPTGVIAPTAIVSTISTILSTLVTALGADTTLHDRTIEKPPAALLPDLGN